MTPASHPRFGITVLVPARDDAVTVGDTVRSLLAQTCPPARIIVIDDHSRDGTAVAARGAGATVVSPPARTGSRAACRNFGLPMVQTELVLAVDPDTTLAPDALETLLLALADAHVAAVSGFVLPRYVRSVWERGRWLEHVLTRALARRFPGFTRPLLPGPGGFTLYRTSRLRALGGWRADALAEDLDIAWRLCRAGNRVRVAPAAIGYRLARAGLSTMSAQSRHRARGLVQSVRLHRDAVRSDPAIRAAVLTAGAEAVIAGLLLLAAPLLALALAHPWPLVATGIPAAAVLVPLAGTRPRRHLAGVVAGIPAFLALRAIEAWHILGALATELVPRRRGAFRRGGAAVMSGPCPTPPSRTFTPTGSPAATAAAASTTTGFTFAPSGAMAPARRASRHAPSTLPFPASSTAGSSRR